METFLNYLEWFIYFNVSFFIRMLIIFHLMIRYRNWLEGKEEIWKKILWGVTKPLWYFIAGLFFIADILYNWYSWLTFKDKPAKWDETLSKRMDRYIEQYKGKVDLDFWEKWRYWFAVKLCKNLGKSDPKHCGDL